MALLSSDGEEASGKVGIFSGPLPRTILFADHISEVEALVRKESQ